MALYRHLDKIESQLVGGRTTFAVEYEGYLYERSLQRAFELLLEKYPVLSGRIHPDQNGYLLFAPEDHPSAFAVHDGDEATLQDLHDAPWDSARAVSQLALVRGEEHGFVAMSVDHAIADGTSFKAMLSELWHIYSDIVNGCEASRDKGASLPSSACELLKQRWPGPAPDYIGAIGDIDFCESINGRLRLNDEDTARLVAFARSQNTTVNALITGAILVVLRRHGATAEPTPMVCMTNVDLRNRVNPPVAATETTNFGGRHKAIVTVPSNGDPVAIGIDIQTQVKRAIANHKLPPYDLGEFFFNRQIDTTLEPRLATISVSNIGAIPRFTQPDGLVITDFIIVKSRVRPTKFPAVYLTYTYDRQLSLHYAYPSHSFTSEEVERLAKSIGEQLDKISASIETA